MAKKVVIAKNTPYEFKCKNISEDPRWVLSGITEENPVISAGVLLESSSLGDTENNSLDKGTHIAERFLPEISSPNGAHINNGSFIIPSVGAFKGMASGWDNRIGPTLCEYTGHIEGSIINNNSTFRTQRENSISYEEIMNFNSVIPEDLRLRWNYTSDISPEVSDTIYLSFYYRSNKEFTPEVEWQIDKNVSTSLIDVPCSLNWQKFTVGVAFQESSLIGPYIKFRYTDPEAEIYVSPVFLSWDENNDFPITEINLLEKWSNKFRQTHLGSIYYTVEDPNPIAPVEYNIRYIDAPEGRAIIDNYCEWFKAWSLIAPNQFIPNYNFAYNTNYSDFNELLNESHINSSSENFFLFKQGFNGEWNLGTQDQIKSLNNIYIADVFNQALISYEPYKYITIDSAVGALLNNKITSAFNTEISENTTVLRSSFFKEGELI